MEVADCPRDLFALSGTWLWAEVRLEVGVSPFRVQVFHLIATMHVCV